MVYLRDARPDLGLGRGEPGTIVETLTEPYPAYLVEFVDDTGATTAEVALAPDELSGTPALA